MIRKTKEEMELQLVMDIRNNIKISTNIVPLWETGENRISWLMQAGVEIFSLFPFFQ